MAGKKSSAEKRHAQSEVRRLHNKAIKSTCKTYAKQFVEAVHAKDQKLAEEKLKCLVSELDSARSKGVLTRNAVSRKKSRMQKLYNVSFAGTNQNSFNIAYSYVPLNCITQAMAIKNSVNLIKEIILNY